MIRQFLQMGGARNEQEFYNKFPTKESFMAAHPEARYLEAMHRMQMGGGAPPQQQDYGDNIEAFLQAQEDYMSSMPQGAAHQVIPQMNMAVGPIPQFIKAPSGDMMSSPGVPQQTTSSYSGNSIVDYLKSQGQDASFAARKQMFGPGYGGTAQQNIDALATLMLNNGEDPDTIGVTNTNTGTVTKKKAPNVETVRTDGKNYVETPPMFAPFTGQSNYTDWEGYLPGVGKSSAINPLTGKPTGSTADAGSKLNMQGSDIVGKAILELTGATAAGALGFFDLMSVADAIENNPKWTGKAKTKLTKSINELRKQALQKAGADVKKVAEMWDKLPKKAQKLYISNFADPQKVEDIISGQIHTMPVSSATSHINAYNATKPSLGSVIAADDALQPYFDDINAEKKRVAEILKNRKALIKRPYMETDLVPALAETEAAGWVKRAGRNLGKNLKNLIPREYGGDTYSNGQFYNQGGSTPYQFNVGGEYDLSEQDVQALINQGYKIEYL